MRIRRALAGLSTLVAAAVLTACSAGGTADVRLAAETPASTSDTATAPATTAPAKPVMAAGVPCTITAKACVSLSGKQAWLLDEGKIVYGPVKIMPGKKGSTTPLGTWHVLYKEKLHLSREFNNAPMPNSVFFYNGVAFHEGSLAKYSNGCVHLSAPVSLKFFSSLSKGDEVQVVR
ncbi:L,D-transpeptidase family protein [Amycolatopsis sp. NBC_00348]|uniref:L,D-transpeptidase family protein n=1 Tax=Amycolatopsis sp. NBC_00348 TaxID=2975956 RepID=UPI002E253AEE